MLDEEQIGPALLDQLQQSAAIGGLGRLGNEMRLVHVGQEQIGRRGALADQVILVLRVTQAADHIVAGSATGASDLYACTRHGRAD